MRQGNGSEILGANDPRSANIGIIHVDPIDDRESVLAAILTQERLGRKQVAVVLPEQNKAFQHPVDFDGLKNMRRKLQAQIIFVAPAGPGPTEFARQRRFPVYSSLEYFANSLQEDDATNQNQADKNGKSGRLFGRRQKPSNAAALSAPASSAPAHPPSKTMLGPLDDETFVDTGPLPDEALYSPSGASNPTGNPPLSYDAMVMPNPAPVDTGMLADADGMEDDMDVSLPPIIPLPVLGADAVADSSAAAQSNGAGVEDDADLADTGSSAEPDIIQLSPRRTRNTGNMRAIPAAQPDPQPINLSTKPRITGKINAVGTPDPVKPASKGTVSTMIPATMSQTAHGGTGGGGIPPRGGTGGGNGSSGGRARRNAAPRWLIAAALIILTLLLVFGGIAYAAPGVLKNFTKIIPGTSLSSPATVTITPTSKTIKNTYVITAVNGTPSASQRQVQARILTYTTPSQSKTAKATGIKQTPGARATGSLTFYNGSASAFTVAAGTLFVTRGVQIVNSSVANIPAASPPNFGTATVPAHAVNVGANGNIAAMALNGTCCTSGNFITVKNLSPFSGGQDPQNYTFVQQSDIDGAANPLKQQLTTTATDNVKGQKRAGEQYVNPTNPVRCTPNITSNNQAGDKANDVTVTVAVTCSAEVYDQQAAETMAADLYKHDSTINPGPGFALVGNVTTKLTQVTVLDNKGTVSLLVEVQGTWVYQITSTQEKAWAKKIAGQSKQAAQDYLSGQTGVSAVTIQLASGNTLPTDPNQITFVINGPGVSGSPTPGQPPPGGTPTPTPTPVNGLGGR